MGFKFCGMYMMDSCWIEKGFCYFGYDIICEDYVVDVGLGFVVKVDKGSDFIGCEVVVYCKEFGFKVWFLQFKLIDLELFLFYNELIFWDGEYVGYVSFGNYGYMLGGVIGMGYVFCEGEKVVDVLVLIYEIDVMGIKVCVEVLLKFMYDLKFECVKVQCFIGFLGWQWFMI